MSAEATPGNDAVRAALVEAAAEMLGELGPRAISVREVARRAGVNHGQVHHYFGGKPGLLRAAMLHLSYNHYARVSEAAGGSPFPPALSVGEDPAYWRALCHAVMDGELELARLEIDEGVSIPRRALRAKLERHPEADPLDIKTGLAASAALQLGWVAFEPFLRLAGEVSEEEGSRIRERIKQIAEQLARTGEA